MEKITYEEFERVHLLSGTIVKVEEFPRAKKPAFKVWADFGPEIGILQTSAQITVHYTPTNLVGRQIVGCVNLGEKNIAGFLSQFLLVGFADENGGICLVTVDPKAPNGKSFAELPKFLGNVQHHSPYINSRILHFGFYNYIGYSYETFCN